MFTYDFMRADWGARPADGFMSLNWNEVEYCIVHYPGTGNVTMANYSDDLLKQKLRDWQDYHIDKKGWTDIAYSVAVDQKGRKYELRGLDRRQGATIGMGRNSVSILIMVGNNEPLTDALKLGVLEVMAEVERRTFMVQHDWHSNFQSTACPGDNARTWGRLGFPAPASELVVTKPAPVVVPVTVTAPDFPLDNGCHAHGRKAYFGPRYPLSNIRSVSGYYSHKSDLLKWQHQMHNRGWTIDADGLYGDQTKRVALAFQKEKGLADDGLIGKETWDAAWTAPVT